MPDISDVTIGDLVKWIVAGLAALSTIVQISPIKFNPWTWLAQKIGRAINGEVIAEVEWLKADVKTIREEAREREAKAARTRILRFGDECRHGVRHSREHFEQVERDIKEYETYCKDHPHFENNTAVFTIQIINEVYKKCLADDSFLK